MANAPRTKPHPAGKGQTIEQAKQWYADSTGLLFADYRGLSVKQLQQLRSDLRKQGAELHVLKNTLFRIAAGDDINSMPDDLHNGPTAVTFVFKNEPDCAKALVDFATKGKVLQVKGGYFGGKAMSAGDVERLAKLPPRDVLIAQVIGAIAAPLSNLVGVVEALYADPIRVIGAVADKVAEGAPAPAPAAAAPAESVAEEAPAEEAPAAAADEAPAEVAETPSEAPAEDTTSAEEGAAPEGE